MAKILIVDDERQIIQQLRALMSSFGHLSDFVPRPELLFRKLELDRFDMILMDVHMPGVNGVDLLKQVKANPHHRQIPVIMLTGDADDQLLVDCFECGAVDFINKPINKQALKARVQSVLATMEYIHKIESQNREIEQQTEQLQHINKELEEQVQERKRMEERLHVIAESAFGASGETFFYLLVQALAQTLGTSYAFIGKFSENKVKTLALYSHDHLESHCAFDVPGSPSEQVLKNGVYFCPEGVKTHFPNDRSIWEMDVEGYMGVPFYGSNGHIQGLIAIMDECPLTHLEVIRSILKIFAIRVAAELERIEVEEHLEDKEARYGAILSNASEGIISINNRGLIELFNPAAERIFGYQAEEIIGQNLAVLMPKSQRGKYKSYLKTYLATSAKKMIGAPREVKGACKDGSLIPLYLSVSEISTKSGPIFTGILRDITEQKEADRKLAQLHRELLEVSHQAGMSEVATSVLHNVGNVLNSVNVSTELIFEKIRSAKLGKLKMAMELVQEHEDDLPHFITEHPQGRRMPLYLLKLSQSLSPFQDELLKEITALSKSVDHIREVVSMQQSVAKVSGVTETLQVKNLLEDVIGFHSEFFQLEQVLLERNFRKVPSIQVNRHKLLQILINLVSNATNALKESRNKPMRLTLNITRDARDFLRIEIIDNGIGVPQENLERIFSHGFTTRENGHGFGLHSSAIAAKEMGGSLRAESDGKNQGACFVLILPLHTAKRAQHPQFQSTHHHAC